MPKKIKFNCQVWYYCFLNFSHMATIPFQQAEPGEGTPESKGETISLKHRIINAFDQVGIVCTN